MAHMTNKKRREREKNDLLRVKNTMNTGTRSMGYKSNNERKMASHLQARKEDLAGSNYKIPQDLLFYCV